MNIVDIILLVFLGAFVLFGVWFGLIHTFGSIVGVVVGTLVAGYFSGWIASFMARVFGRPELMKTIAFLLILLVTARLIGFVFYWLDRKFDFLLNLPFLGSIDRLLGGILGFFEGLLIMGVTLFVISQSQIDPRVISLIEASKIAPWLISVSSILQNLLPKSFTKVI